MKEQLPHLDGFGIPSACGSFTLRDRSFILIFHFGNSHHINMTLVFKAKTKNKIINPKTSIYLFTVPNCYPVRIFLFIFQKPIFELGWVFFGNFFEGSVEI